MFYRVRISWSMAVPAVGVVRLGRLLTDNVHPDEVLEADFEPNSAALVISTHVGASQVVRAVGLWVKEWPAIGLGRQAVKIEVKEEP